MSWVEAAGFVTGALCVCLIVRENPWNFPVGMANSGLFIVLFVDVGLYADAGLQGVYIGLAMLGWRWWLWGGRAGRVSRSTRQRHGSWRAASCW